MKRRIKSLKGLIGLMVLAGGTVVSGVGIVSSILGAEEAGAVGYQDSADVQFTINPTLSISLSADLTIENLYPGSYSDSNIITVGIATNSAYGYHLSATAGTSTGNTNLVNTTSSSHTFTNLASNKASLATFDDNYWGYSYSIDNGTSWISGSQGSTSTGYNGLPLDNNDQGATGITLVDTTEAVDNKNVQFKIGAKAGPTQAAGTYTGQVNFYAVTYDPPEPDPCEGVNTLYCNIASMSKGAQTATDLQAEITTDNSGVYEYNSSVFGTSSDAANTSKIYYYRGILDNTVGIYGSNGDNAAYPNTVVLSSASSKSGLTANSDTCWRIVRTTGSGGVKMIYQGKWTGSTCANATTNAQVTTQAFGLRGNSAQSTYWYHNINRVGYTFNNDSSIQDSTTAISVDTVFGSDSNPILNNARSNIKTYIEDTWYAANMTNYTERLEYSAGYCNDRTAYSNAQLNPTALTEIPPYATSSATMYFGARERVAVAGATPTLNCPREHVDLYQYNRYATGETAELYMNLKYPVALITADEAAFAGSGYSPSTTPYHANSFLRSGSDFWLLSPSIRHSSGRAHGFGLYSSGNLDSNYVGTALGVRPAISLKLGTAPTSGTGTAADPWIINP